MVTLVVEDQKMSGFNRPTTILSVPLTSSITLEAGSFGEEGDTLTILPPSVANVRSTRELAIPPNTTGPGRVQHRNDRNRRNRSLLAVGHLSGSLAGRTQAA